MAATETPTGEEHITDVEIVPEGQPATSTALAVAPAPSVAVAPQVEAAELVQRLDVIKDAMANAMVEGVDYGKIPGAQKPSLYKPGAEKLGVLFQLDVQIKDAKTWGPGEHLTVESEATVYHIPTGTRMGNGGGLCTTREKKYAKRRAERVCPECGVAAIIKGKAEYGGGWVCFKKKDGCGAKFPDDADVIVNQEAGEVDNPDLADYWNTVVKMARKRARVDAILNVTGASALFTQDVEDTVPPAAEGTAPAMGDLQHPYGGPADASLLKQTRRALAWMLGTPEDDERVTVVLAKVAEKADGYLPAIAAKAVGLTVGAFKAGQEAGQAMRDAQQPPAPEAGQTSMADQLNANQPEPDPDAPAPGSLANAPAAIKANTCTCECGYEQAEADDVDPSLLSTDCPVHGVPFN